MKNKGLIGLIIALLFGGGYVVNDQFGGATGAHTERGCASVSVTPVEIGNQNSVQLIASGTRAFVRLQQPVNATNTLTIAFNNDAPAVLHQGVTFDVLDNGTTSPKHIDFGLKTDFPYTGAVTGITETGSTTLIRTQCNY